MDTRKDNTIVLCRRFITTSEVKLLCHVPVRNLRTKKSSKVVCAALFSSCKLPVLKESHPFLTFILLGGIASSYVSCFVLNGVIFGTPDFLFLHSDAVEEIHLDVCQVWDKEVFNLQN
ncbi:hypothetical protein EGW08_012384, partial [Elysia chlorotica]